VNDQCSETLGPSALMMACEGAKSLELVKLLLDRGAKINEVDHFGENARMKVTPQLELEEVSRRAKVIEIIMDRGANVKQRQKATGQTALC
jgi:ankyrin repeat protein